jgi:group I intron endonuclease
MFYVYRITNKVNGKIYIGKAKDALKRFRIHIKIAKGGKEKYPRKFQAIHAAIAKYGIENFTLEIMHEVQTEQESFDLEVIEIASIRKASLPCYNLSDGGEGNSGWHHTKETRQKMSKAGKGKKHSEEHRKAQSEAVKGKKSFMFGTHLSTQWKESIGKLTATQVLEIKNLIANGIRARKIASIYKVSEANISMIKHGKIWSDII